MEIIKKVSQVIVIMVIASLGFAGCGSRNMNHELRNGFYMDTENISQETKKYASDSIDILFGKAIDKFEDTYGSCGKEVFIDIREDSFFSEELDKDVSGLNYNYGDSCKIIVVLDPTSGCESAQILWHELYHCCKDEHDHGDWVYDLFEMRDNWEKDGEC